jgi:hypothetical protein
MPEKSIEVTVKPVYLKNSYVYIPVKHTGFFPPGEPHTVKPITVEAGKDSFPAQPQSTAKPTSDY